VANLESYDTRLWFVVIFIPIIPLGRKRIIDACPFCRRHFAANADTYEQSKQLQISGSLEEYRRAASPESALKAHGQLCRGIPALANSSLHVQTLLAMQKGKEVAADPSFEKNWEKPLISLALSLELSLEGQPEESARWRERAIKKFETATPLIRPVAKFLASSEPPALADLSRLQIEVDDKALLCAALADRFPAKRAEYQAAASRYNILRQPPYHLVSRAIQATSGSKP